MGQHAAGEESVVAAILARGYLSPADIEAARQQTERMRAAGVPGTLLTVLGQRLSPAIVAELSAVYREAIANPTGAPGGGQDPHAAGTVVRDPHAAGTVVRDPHAAGTVVRDPHAAGTVGAEGPARRAGLPRPGERIGSYEVVRELARGGMGAVFVARHVELPRQVALKVMLGGAEATAEEQSRFLNEAQAAAKLQHPGVVTVHEVGMDQGRAFLAMELVEGESLEDRLRREGRLDPEEAARLVADVARTLDAAHAVGVLHRDMKPGNVLLGPDGSARVTDFGIARDMHEAERLTRTGQLLGTPVYMPPEQAQGRKDLDARADVYSLGAILYELITGQRLFEGATVANILVKVTRVEPTPPRSLRKDLPPALEQVCLKALSKRRMDRYPSAGELAADLDRFLAGEAVEARPRGSGGRAGRWLRSPWGVATASAALLVLLGAAALLPRGATEEVAQAPDEVGPATDPPSSPSQAADASLWTLAAGDELQVSVDAREQSPTSTIQLEAELRLRVMSVGTDGLAQLEGRFAWVRLDYAASVSMGSQPFDSRSPTTQPHAFDGLREVMGLPFRLSLDTATGATSEVEGLEALLELADRTPTPANYTHTRRQLLRAGFYRSVFACFHVLGSEGLPWRSRTPGAFSVRQRGSPPLLTTLIGADAAPAYSIRGKARYEGGRLASGELSQEPDGSAGVGASCIYKVEVAPAENQAGTPLWTLVPGERLVGKMTYSEQTAENQLELGAEFDLEVTGREGNRAQLALRVEQLHLLVGPRGIGGVPFDTRTSPADHPLANLRRVSGATFVVDLDLLTGNVSRVVGPSATCAGILEQGVSGVGPLPEQAVRGVLGRLLRDEFFRARFDALFGVRPHAGGLPWTRPSGSEDGATRFVLREARPQPSLPEGLGRPAGLSDAFERSGAARFSEGHLVEGDVREVSTDDANVRTSFLLTLAPAD
jgi:predicted Ser/Thr protein kinase